MKPEQPVINYTAVLGRPPIFDIGRMLLLVGVLGLIVNAAWLYGQFGTWQLAVQNATQPFAGWVHNPQTWSSPLPSLDPVRFSIVFAEAALSLLISASMIVLGILAFRQHAAGVRMATFVATASTVTVCIGTLATVWWASNFHDVIKEYNVEGDPLDARLIWGTLAIIRLIVGGYLATIVRRRLSAFQKGMVPSPSSQ